MSDPCPNCARLEAERDTARDELANGSKVLDAREQHSRAEVAELKAKLLSVHDLASARITGSNAQASLDMWAHDMREIARVSGGDT